MVIDCGTGNYILFSNVNGQPTSFFFDAVEISLGSRANLGLKCMSTHDVVLSSGVNYMMLAQPDYVSISAYLLYGLAGLICGGFVVYAILKNA